MTEWFARPILHVKDVDASFRFAFMRALALRAHGAMTRRAERELHKSTGRAALATREAQKGDIHHARGSSFRFSGVTALDNIATLPST